MTRKKIYICFALLFCAPTALFSAQNQKWALVEIRTSNPRELNAVFAPPGMKITELYNTLTSKGGYNLIRSLHLYTEGGENQTIWSETNKGNGEKKLSEIKGEGNPAGNEEEEKVFSKKLETWYSGRKKDIGYTNEIKLKKISIIEGRSPNYQMSEMGVLLIKYLFGKMSILVQKEKFNQSTTIRDIKTKISAKDQCNRTFLRLIHTDKQLKDGNTLADYNIQNMEEIALVVVEKNHKIHDSNSDNDQNPNKGNISTNNSPITQTQLKDKDETEVQDGDNINLTNDASNLQKQLQGQPKNKVSKKKNINPTNDTPNPQTQLQDKDKDNIDHTNDASNLQKQLQGQPKNKVPKKKNINLTNNASNPQIQQQRINTDNNQNGDEPQQNENSDEAPPLYTNPKIILIGSCIIGCVFYIILNSKQVNNKTRRRHRAKQKAS